jgi:hypothetical protein
MMDEIIGVKGLDAWFAERLQGLRYRPETLAYVGGVLKTLSHPRAEDDLSKQSIVLAYAAARKNGDFATFQRLGDWVLWVDMIFPESIEGSREAIESIGRLSYYACHRIMRGQWVVYEELADELPRIAARVRRSLV